MARLIKPYLAQNKRDNHRQHRLKFGFCNVNQQNGNVANFNTVIIVKRQPDFYLVNSASRNIKEIQEIRRAKM